MHRSRIGIVLIDHPERDWEPGLAFWAGVQGVQPVLEEGDEEVYRSIGTIGSLALASQRTGEGTPPASTSTSRPTTWPPRSPAWSGSARRCVEDRDYYTILRDPGGLVFCVVPVQTGDLFEQDARTWP